MVLNYHRIGMPAECPYDRDVISATPEAFDEQVRFLKSSFHVAGPGEVEEIADRPNRLKRMIVALTFDDGYRDNHDLAFPILRSHGMAAFFFLPTSYIGTSRVPWWDQVAFMVRNTRKLVLRMSYPTPVEYRIPSEGPDGVIREILRRFAAPDVHEPERFLHDVEVACGVNRPEHSPAPLFLDWCQVSRLSEAGMGIGSHTHRHDILGRMPVQKQREEFEVSRRVLEERTGKPVRTLAYPVGTPTSFTPRTASLLAEVGYKAGFSYYGGINTKHGFDPFNIRRIAVETDIAHSVLKLRVLAAAISGREII